MVTKSGENINKNSDEITFFWGGGKCKKKSYPLSFPILRERDSTRALQSSPFQNQGGVAQALQTENDGRKSLCLK